MGNERHTIQNLSEFLQSSSKIPRSKIDSFIRNMFAIIKAGIDQDGFVKVKGLGTFKIITVNSRESINVNTGERIEIGEHQKLTFTPDKSLKERINRPFEAFETSFIEDDDFQSTAAGKEEEETEDVDFVEDTDTCASDSYPAFSANAEKEGSGESREENPDTQNVEDANHTLTQTLNLGASEDDGPNTEEIITTNIILSNMNDNFEKNNETPVSSEVQQPTESGETTESTVDQKETTNEQEVIETTEAPTQAVDLVESEDIKPETEETATIEDAEPNVSNDTAIGAEGDAANQTEQVEPTNENTDTSSASNATDEEATESAGEEYEEEAEDNNEENKEENKGDNQADSSNSFIKTLLSILGIILLCCISYVAGYNRVINLDGLTQCKSECTDDSLGTTLADTIATDSTMMTPETETPADSTASENEVAKDSVQTTQEAAEETPSTEETPKVEEEKDEPATETDESEPSKNYKQLSHADYLIVGVKEEHTVQSGETLNKIAQKVYGDKSYAKYIIFFNKISNPDFVPEGKVLKLPELKKK